MDRTALIIDDSSTCQAILRKSLEQNSYTVHCETTGHAGLTYLHSNPMQIVFLDETLAEENGLNVLTKIKAQNSHQTVIMYTAQEDQDYVQLAKTKGALGVLNKNLNNDSLSKMLSLVNQAPISTQSAPTALKSVLPLADIDSEKLEPKPAKSQQEDELAVIFNRARYDNLKYHVEVLEDKRKSDAFRFKALLGVMALPLLFLLGQTLFSTPEPQTLVSTGSNANIEQLEYNLAKQEKVVEVLTQKLDEQQLFIDSLKDNFQQVTLSQQALENRIAKTQRLVDDVQIEVNTAKTEELLKPMTHSPDTNTEQDLTKVPISRSEADAYSKADRENENQ